MEIVSVCTGRAWRARVTTNDNNARGVIERLRADESIAAGWTAIGSGAWRLEGPHEYATVEDSIVDVVVESAGTQAAVKATLSDRVTTIANATGASPKDRLWKCGDLVRMATAAETIELGLRWTLGWGHLGCLHPDEFAFWGTKTNAVVFVVDAPQRWLAASAPLPEGIGRSAFTAYCGPRGLHDVVKAVSLVAERAGDGFVGGGMFPSEGRSTHALVAVAHVEP